MPFADVDGRQIEYRMIPGDALEQPTLVFLHEGLGSVALWRDFPDKVAARLGARALVYSRFGYGQSGGLLAKRTPEFMHTEALEVLPRLLDRLGIERPLIIGHSDGASIAIIYAGSSGHPVHGLVLMAPHVNIEPFNIESIARVRESYATTDLKQRLAKYHARVDDAFLGWADIWLDPAFRTWSIEAYVDRIAAPMLLIQGLDDEYGTLAQLDCIEERARASTTRLVLNNCRHSPHRDQEAAVVDAIAAFAGGLGLERTATPRPHKGDH
ncbi:MAG: alpha/beta hydrolase [Hyphomicrobiaceae bacterium]|nr:MAG: alpha/beta hydrolase [Hyphomicrobiaceae bacterium]